LFLILFLIKVYAIYHNTTPQSALWYELKFSPFGLWYKHYTKLPKCCIYNHFNNKF